VLDHMGGPPSAKPAVEERGKDHVAPPPAGTARTPSSGKETGSEVGPSSSSSATKTGSSVVQPPPGRLGPNAAGAKPAKSGATGRPTGTPTKTTVGTTQAANNAPTHPVQRPLKVVPPQFADTSEAKALYDQGALFVDARFASVFAEGHIQGAISLPVDSFEKYFPQLEDQLKKATAIVTYCDELPCERATELAKLLSDRGFASVHIFFEGFGVWEKAGNPTAKGQ
jgi:rhodanese-related sulfurtransferase